MRFALETYDCIPVYVIPRVSRDYHVGVACCANAIFVSRDN
jgi:hypothetical protein